MIPNSPSPPSLSAVSTSARSYLQPVTTMNDNDLATLKSLLRITIDVRRTTSKTYRIRRGSPGAGALGSTLVEFQTHLNDILDDLIEVMKTHETFPGMYLVSRQFPVFRDVLFGQFNDGGNDPGYNERVHLLEKLMYVAGTLRGHLEMVLEQHSYWRAKLAGEKPSRLARRLNFDLAVDPAVEGESEVSETGQAAKDSLQNQLPSDNQTFKVSVSLPQELQSAMTIIWDEQKFTDIDFIISGQVIPAHKAILAAQSQYFECMLYGSMREASMSTVTLEDVSVPAFRKVLGFAYTGSLHMDNVTLQDILEVSTVADRFGFVSLKEALGDQLSLNYVSLDTVLLLLVHSDIHHLQQLHTTCLTFIENRSNSVNVLRHASLLLLPESSLISIISRDSFVVPEIEVLKAVERWKKHNSKEVEEIGKLLECVRLSEFTSAEQIFGEVEPTGLLDSQIILSGVRTICKPCLTDMRPRGRKEANKNWFTSAKVTFDSFAGVHYNASGNRSSRRKGLGSPPQSCVSDAVVQLGTGVHNQLYLGTRGSSTPSTSSIVVLDDLYIINYLNIKGYPSMDDENQMGGKSFSYTVLISRDKYNWVKLFDYTSYACWGGQHLPFPRQAARYIKVDLKWKEDETQPLPLQFSACCFLKEPRPFTFLPNGIIAPRYEHDVVTISQMYSNDGIQTVRAHFRQPYSASFLRFTIECSDKAVKSVDMSVNVGIESSGDGDKEKTKNQGASSRGSGSGGLQLGGPPNTLFGAAPNYNIAGSQQEGGFRLGTAGSAGSDVGSVAKGKRRGSLKENIKIKDIDEAPLNSPIEIEMKEKIVNCLEVKIQKVHKIEEKTTVESPGDAKNMSSVSNEVSAKQEPEPVKPTATTSVPATSTSVPSLSLGAKELHQHSLNATPVTSGLGVITSQSGITTSFFSSGQGAVLKYSTQPFSLGGSGATSRPLLAQVALSKPTSTTQHAGELLSSGLQLGGGLQLASSRPPSQLAGGLQLGLGGSRQPPQVTSGLQLGGGSQLASSRPPPQLAGGLQLGLGGSGLPPQVAIGSQLGGSRAPAQLNFGTSSACSTLPFTSNVSNTSSTATTASSGLVAATTLPNQPSQNTKVQPTSSSPTFKIVNVVVKSSLS